MKKIFLSLFIILIFSNVSFACLGIGPEFFGKMEGPLHKEERKKIAVVIKKEIKKIYDSVPNLSPSEEKWLKNELSPLNPQRMINALESNENYLKNAKERTELLLLALNTIIEEKYKNQKQEVLLWSGIGTEIINSAFSNDIKTLVQRERIHIPDGESKSVFLSYGNESLDLACDMVGRAIFNKITIPYLADTLPE